MTLTSLLIGKYSFYRFVVRENVFQYWILSRRMEGQLLVNPDECYPTYLDQGVGDRGYWDPRTRFIHLPVEGLAQERNGERWIIEPELSSGEQWIWEHEGFHHVCYGTPLMQLIFLLNSIDTIEFMVAVEHVASSPQLRITDGNFVKEPLLYVVLLDNIIERLCNFSRGCMETYAIIEYPTPNGIEGYFEFLERELEKNQPIEREFSYQVQSLLFELCLDLKGEIGSNGAKRLIESLCLIALSAPVFPFSLKSFFEDRSRYWVNQFGLEAVGADLELDYVADSRVINLLHQVVQNREDICDLFTETSEGVDLWSAAVARTNAKMIGMDFHEPSEFETQYDEFTDIMRDREASAGPYTQFHDQIDSLMKRTSPNSGYSGVVFYQQEEGPVPVTQGLPDDLEAFFISLLSIQNLKSQFKEAVVDPHASIDCLNLEFCPEDCSECGINRWVEATTFLADHVREKYDFDAILRGDKPINLDFLNP